MTACGRGGTGGIDVSPVPAGRAMPDGVGRLAPPSLRDAFEAGRSTPRAVAARVQSEVVGLAIGLTDACGNMQLGSVYVDPFRRRRGVGRLLVRMLEAQFTSAGSKYGVCEVIVDPAREAVTRLLEACGYRAQGMNHVRGRASAARALTARFFKPERLLPGYRLVPWVDLSASQRTELRMSGRFAWSDATDPFVSEAGCEPVSSLALLQPAGAGEPVVAGWTINHVAGDTTLLWTNSFVDPALQTAGLAWPLWKETLTRQLALTPYKDFVFAVHASTPRMARFTERRLRPILSDISYTHTFSHLLSPAPALVPVLGSGLGPVVPGGVR